MTDDEQAAAVQEALVKGRKCEVCGVIVVDDKWFPLGMDRPFHCVDCWWKNIWLPLDVLK